MDQIASVHNEKAVHSPDLTRHDPAIDGLPFASKNLRDLRDSQIFALWRSNFCCLPAHDRPAWLFGFMFYRRRILRIERRALPQAACQTKNPPNRRFLAYPRFSKSVQCGDLARTLYERSVSTKMRPSIVAVVPSLKLDCPHPIPHCVPIRHRRIHRASIAADLAVLELCRCLFALRWGKLFFALGLL